MPDLLGRLQTALGDRYAVESEIGRGGMATVFLAEDLRHERKVAIKVLHPELAATLGTARFLSEIKIAASLNHPHILPLFDSGEAAGLLYYVMPFVEGESLQERLEGEIQLPIDEAVEIAAEVAEGLDYAHRQGVIHRDIKPGNILLSEGHALIADFGVARAVGEASEGEAIAVGLAVGTPRYMSPEQATAATSVDGRSDIYALGCVLWEMLAGEPPFTGPTPQAIMARKAVEEAPDVRVVRGRVPEALEECLEGALAPAPPDRFGTAADFASALRDAFVLGVTPQAVARRKRRRRRRLAMAGLAVVAAIGGALVWQAYQARRQVEWARTEAIPEIKRLVREGKNDSALDVATRAEAIASPDTVLDLLWPWFSRLFSIATEPEGARLYRRPFAADPDAPWRPLGVTPLDSIRRPLSAMRWRFELEGHVSREYATAPYGRLRGAVTLDPAQSAPDGMVRIDGFEVYEGWWDWAPTSFAAGEFFLDRYEVTNRQYRVFVEAGGYESSEYWVEPFTESGVAVPLANAMDRFVDRSGRPGPATWENGTYPAGHDEYPVGGVSWYEAAAYARFAGKSLPSLWHLDYAIDDGLNPYIIPLSAIDVPAPLPVGSLPTIGTFGAYDQYGNVREWVYNAEGDDRLAFGGAWTDSDYLRADWEGRKLSPWDRSPENGLRLALYPDTAGIASANAPLLHWESLPYRDYREETPAGDDDFEVYARYYTYESYPLDDVVELADTVDGWPMERVRFAGPDAGQTMGAYVFLPRHQRPPYQTVLFFVAYASTLPNLLATYTGLFDYFLDDGRAIVVPILTGTFQPYDPDSGVYEGDRGMFEQPREIVIQWVRELLRTVDYLVTRPDLDRQRVAYFGMYFGAIHAPIFLALDPRIAVGFVESGALGTGLDAPPPEVDPFHFLPRVKTPLLIMNGRYSGNWPYATSQVPMLENLGTPEEHRRLVSGQFWQFVPYPEIIPEATRWLDKYLGPVQGF